MDIVERMEVRSHRMMLRAARRESREEMTMCLETIRVLAKRLMKIRAFIDSCPAHDGPRRFPNGRVVPSVN